MTASNAELVQVHYQKLKNIHFCITHLQQTSFHVHSSMEIGVVMSGSVQICCNEHTYTATPGSLILFNAYEPHRLSPEPEAEILLLQLAPSFGKEYFARVVNVEFSSIASVDQQVRQKLLHSILDAATVYFREPEAYGMECAGLVAQAVTVMLRNLPYNLSTDSEYLIKKKKIGRQQRIASFVEQHYREKLTLAQLAQSEGITTAYMSRIFTELFCTSFQNYLSKLRLQKALPMLKKTSIYLVDICMECGFSDTRYLNAICQKEYGCSATQLRERMQDPAWQDPHEVPQIHESNYDDATCLRILQEFRSRQLEHESQ